MDSVIERTIGFRFKIYVYIQTDAYTYNITINIARVG